MHTVEGRIAAQLHLLPAVARRKYEALAALVADGAALTRAAMEREKLLEDRVFDLQRRLRYVAAGTGEPVLERALRTELDDARAALQSANDERTKRQGLRGNAEQVLAQLRHTFLAGDGVGGPYGVCAYGGAKAEPRNGESLADAILRVRSALGRLQSELAAVRAAPPSAQEARAQIVAGVERLAERGRPQLSLAAGRATLQFADVLQHGTPGSALSAPSGSASALLCWLFRDDIIRLCTAQLDDAAGGLSAAERRARTAELE